MKIIIFILNLITFVSFQNYSSSAQYINNILSNSGFDTPIHHSIGYNLTGLFTFNGGWIITGGSFNVIRTDGSASIDIISLPLLTVLASSILEPFPL